MRYSFVVVLILLLGAACTQKQLSPYQNLNASYVGMDACAGCHADKVATFTQSQMGRSWELATPANSSADFKNPLPVYDEFHDLYYQGVRKADDLYVMEYRLSGADTVHKRVEKIDYIVGSGHHTNSHIMEINGYLYQMPLTWYVQQQKWDLPPGFKGANNSRFDRPIPLKCITCHNAMPEYIEGSENRYVSVPHGIDCERCHGPGSLHIESIQSGNVVNVAVETDFTIVNPAKLPVEKQFDICQGCHLQGASVNKPGHSFADFRPGMSLSSIENVFWPRYADSLRQFVMASHPDRLRQSACFQASPTAMTCITCHDPHIPIEAMAENHYRDVCQSCHTVDKQNLVCPTEEAALGQDCTGCHMPISGSEDIPHVTITDHFIRSPDEELLEVINSNAEADLIRMASLVDESPSDVEIAQGFLTYYETITNAPGFLDSASVYLRRASRAGENVDEHLIRMHFLRQEPTSVLRIARNLESSTDAWTAYRIGESYLTQQMPRQAVIYLEQAVEAAPKHLRFMIRLGVAYSEAGRIEDALTVFNTALELNPKQADAYNNRGFAHILSNHFDRAEEDFKSAIALDPDLELAMANLASLYYNTSRPTEARPYMQRLIEMDPDNPQYRQLWELVR